MICFFCIRILYSVSIESRRTEHKTIEFNKRKTLLTVISKAQRWWLSVGAPDACALLTDFRGCSCFFWNIISSLYWPSTTQKFTVTLHMSKIVDKSPPGAQTAIPRIRLNNMLQTYGFSSMTIGEFTKSPFCKVDLQCLWLWKCVNDRHYWFFNYKVEKYFCSTSGLE